MSYTNPTQLRIGSTGTLAAKDYRVTGWAVMKVMTTGEAYYWTEFNIECNDGHSATLVYEETERGGEWRLFLLFEPKNPISAADAATKRVGDVLTLDGKEYRITLVDKSRVCRVEGKAAEGVNAGTVANYFNAQAGSTTMVVSWTGEEVDYYLGWTLPRSVVEKAFNIPRPALSTLTFSRPPGKSPSGGWTIFIIVALLMLAYFVVPASCDRASRREVAVKSFSLPTTQLKTGATGNLAGRHFRIVGHEIATITEVGRRFSRHEFGLSDDGGVSFLLISGFDPDSKDWLLLQPLPPTSLSMTASQAGNVRLGQSIEVDGSIVKVTGLFLCTTRRGEDSAQTGTWDVETYGFSGRTGNTFVHARWNGAGMVCYRGNLLTEKTVHRAFKESSGK